MGGARGFDGDPQGTDGAVLGGADGVADIANPHVEQNCEPSGFW